MPWLTARFSVCSGAEADLRLSEYVLNVGIRPGLDVDQVERHAMIAPHRITSSARSRSDCGIVRPSELAVLRLMTEAHPHEGTDEAKHHSCAGSLCAS